MIDPIRKLPDQKKIFFASDFHLGVPDYESSLIREKKIVKWLNNIKPEAHSVFILGDIFDFWFEYKTAIPKGYIRLQGKFAEFTDDGIPVNFFTGNHDMWMFDYFPKEFNIPVFREPQILQVQEKKLLIGHGDGLGPGDNLYKFQKKVFRNPLAQWVFARFHPNIGIGFANYLSRKSRVRNSRKDEIFKDDEEWLYLYCKEVEKLNHHDLYIFGHRHLPLDLPVGDTSRYINLGEWVNHFTYGEFDGENFKLLKFNDQS